MDSSPSHKEFEDELIEAGNKLLLSPPESIDELLCLLDRLESLLNKVPQAPIETMQEALLPAMEVFIGKELLRHSDTNVKMSVASCINEIIRITAPDAPYNDELMKEIFQLIMVALEELSCVSSRYYSKAVKILETAAKIRSCLVLLDLECDELVVQLFQQLLNTIKPNHPYSVFTDMETIMTLIIEESEEISMELLSVLLASVKNENLNVFPNSWKLGEQVLRNNAEKLENHLPQAIEYMNLSTNDYAEIVSSICEHAEAKEVSQMRNILEVERDAKLVLKKRGRKPKSSTKAEKKRLKKSSELRNEKKNCAFPSETTQNQILDESPSQNQSIPEGSHRKRGRPRKNEKMINQDAGLDSSSVEDHKKWVSPSNENDMDGASKAKGKRKLTLQKGKVTRFINEYGEDLVGSKIKVWWPLDQEFYEGVIASFDPVKRMHKVLYLDGDEEILNLRKERWEFLGNDSQDQEQEADLPSFAALSSNETFANDSSTEKAYKFMDNSTLENSCTEQEPKDNAVENGDKSKATDKL